MYNTTTPTEPWVDTIIIQIFTNTPEQWPYREPALYSANIQLTQCLQTCLTIRAETCHRKQRCDNWQAPQVFLCLLLIGTQFQRATFPNDLDLKGTGKTKRPDETKAAANPKLIIRNSRHKTRSIDSRWIRTKHTSFICSKSIEGKYGDVQSRSPCRWRPTAHTHPVYN